MISICKRLCLIVCHIKLKNKIFSFKIHEFRLINTYKKTTKKEFKYKDNINFAISYLSMTGYLSRQKRGVYKISELGLSESKKDLNFISISYLSSLSLEFKERITTNHSRKTKQEENLAREIFSIGLNRVE